ncbi:hypothetical protein BJ085DRAFT_42878 [Dimargaris cristalligena]|uniref:Methyltransferase small domain-containing protein n=1 Tax=Dimargaris cristalligena TaxID=215637 RepID=A0A4P9ZQE0_9FUNG|nr:hypothetical protein BJ085DRAFT_42878 [Dimargaris cristalligena]|eukprot:RKP35694.1 hypothetical protein BJ085DRAFT_42878 [Dimargaris cristalligena]
MASYLPTPDLSHLKSADYHNVYEPAEDSFLLLDALELEAPFLNDQLQPRWCLEVGAGSGIVSTFLAGQVLGSRAVDFGTCFVVTDLNPRALPVTQATWARNGLALHRLHCIQTDFIRGWRPAAQGFDVLVFNPPYVVTSPEEVGSQPRGRGGIDGRQVIDQFLPIVPTILSDRGVFYLVLIEQNRPQEIISIMRDQYGLLGSIVAQRKAGIEYLYIVKFSRDTSTT